MSSRIEVQNKLLEEFSSVTAALDEVLKDLEWRKPDVEAEEAKLAELRRMAKEGAIVDAESQAVVARVLRAVLDDKIALAEGLENRMLQLQTQLEALEKEPEEQGIVGESGEAVREEEERLG